MNRKIVELLEGYVHFSDLLKNKKKIFAPHKIVVDLFFSNKCNLKCRHCYFGDTQNISSSVSLDEWLFLIDSLYKKGIRHFHISGKELSLVPDSIKLIKHIKEKKGAYCGIVTNGTGKHEFYKEILLKNVDYIEFSIDGLKDKHNFIRRKDVFDINANIIKGICEISPPETIDISTTLNNINYNEYLGVVTYFRKIGVRRFFATPFLEKGSGYDIQEMSISANQYSDLILETFDYLKNIDDKDIIVKYCVPHHLIIPLWEECATIRNYIEDYLSGDNNLFFEINGNYLQLSFSFIDVDYLNMLVITNDGYIIPCADDISNNNYAQFSLGNIHENTISDIFIKRKKYIENELNNLLN